MRARRARTCPARTGGSIAAVQKLVYDGCSFEEPDAETAAALRREIFRRAAAERRAATPSAPFDRGALLEAAARARGTTAADRRRRAVRRSAGAATAARVRRPPTGHAGRRLRARRGAGGAAARDARDRQRPFARRRDVPPAVPDTQVPAPAARGGRGGRRRLPHQPRRTAQPVPGRHALRPAAGPGATGDRRVRQLVDRGGRPLGRGPPPAHVPRRRRRPGDGRRGARRRCPTSWPRS